MPGTVQELASMFRRAIDPQGNVLDMGVVKEVVAALERSPVSARDLKDLKSTRLGKYINQVRRLIADKSLAKRMKKLVIQWRSLAQQAPNTANGVPPSQTTPPPTHTSPSPASPHPTSTIPTSAQNSPTSCTLVLPQPTVPLPPDNSTPPISRASPSSANPALSRKRALHRLSKLQHPLKSVSPSPLLPPSSQPHPLSPSPPITSQTATPGTKPSPSSGETVDKMVDVPDSLQVRLPLHSVVKKLIVRIPLIHVNLSLQPLTASSGSGTSTNESKPLTLNKTHNRKLPDSGTNTTECSQLLTQKVGPNGDSKIKPSSMPEAGESDRLMAEPLSLIVSVSRDLLQLPAHSNHTTSVDGSDSNQATPCVSDTTVQDISAPADNISLESSCTNDISESSIQQELVERCSSSECGSVCTDGVWRQWTKAIIHSDSFAVNILPYVYVDGMDDDDISEPIVRE